MPLNDEAINQVYNNAVGVANGDKAAAAQILKDAIKKFNNKVLIHEPDLNINANMLEDLYGDGDNAMPPIYEEDDEEEVAMDGPGPMEEDDGGEEAPAGEFDPAHFHVDAGNLPAQVAAPAVVNNLIDNLHVEFQQPAANVGAIPALQANYIAPAGQPVIQHAAAEGGYLPPKAVLNDHYAFKQKIVAGNHGHDLVGYGEKAADGTKGLMVFYINTQGLGSGAALDLLDKVKMQYKKTQANLIASGVEVMWLPTGTGDTGAEFFSFR